MLEYKNESERKVKFSKIKQPNSLVLLGTTIPDKSVTDGEWMLGS